MTDEVPVIENPKIRPREDADDTEPTAKRTKLDDDTPATVDSTLSQSPMITDAPTSEEEPQESMLPPSHSLLGVPPPFKTLDGSLQRIMETDVGISEYISHDVPQIAGIIKQRFTDFLVFEVDLDGNVVHLKSLAKPQSTTKKPTESSDTKTEDPGNAASSTAQTPSVEESSAPGATATKVTTETQSEAPAAEVEATARSAEAQAPEVPAEEDVPWPERFTTTLSAFLSEEVIERVKTMYLEGPEPPFVSDSGWGGRQAKAEGGSADATVEANQPDADAEKSDRGGRGRDRGGRGKRGGRGGRGGRAGARQDNRKVVSDPIASKSTRTGLHQAIRELFGGKLDTETDTTAPADDDGSKIVIKWSKAGGGRGGGRGGARGGRSDRGGRGERNTYPPYIHFTMQKANRDTQDALAHLSRQLHVNVKDLSVAGTKDKRGVTVQRVSLRRGNKTVEDVWTMANNVGSRRTAEEAVTQRGERGIRVADFNYRKASLELGMLKGNAFVITLRNVQVDSMETLDRAMNAIKNKGFINYYGMQRFGTASIPTHSIGLALLQSDWHKAVSLILRNRPGEHPDVVAARNAWLVDGDLDRALELMPRRVVAERCILESYQKQGGETRNAMGALSTIPRNLRLMYVHAYQSYVWNAIVSERIKKYGAERPVAGDLVFDTDSPEEAPTDEPALEKTEEDNEADVVDEKATAEEEASGSAPRSKRSRKPWQAQKVKTLTEEDLDKYTIFDVIMPLPGKDVAFPGGPLGERYKEFLRLDGLDPSNFSRKQKEYSLAGSYRKILHLPKELSWSVLRYTDPDVSLAQADEDKLLGFDPPAIVEDGKFLALQVQLTLGTAAYATMALREITKTETSSHYQTTLTLASEDQKYKTAAAGDDGEGEDK